MIEEVSKLAQGAINAEAETKPDSEAAHDEHVDAGDNEGRGESEDPEEDPAADID